MKILIILIFILLTACASPLENKERVKISPERRLAVPYESEITLGEAFTEIKDRGANRVSNIVNACTRISGMKLKPGEELSFNSLTGKKTSANGYKEAPVLVDGEKSEGIGGGVCQVSTTLFMAAKNAGLEITEHHNHSESVSYAPEGMDATVVYGAKDMKFKNNLENGIYIYLWIQDGKCYAKIVQSN